MWRLPPGFARDCRGPLYWRFRTLREYGYLQPPAVASIQTQVYMAPLPDEALESAAGQKVMAALTRKLKDLF